MKSTPSTEPAIHIRGLTKNFGSVRALDGLDLDIKHGEVHGFLGPNGGGEVHHDPDPPRHAARRCRHRDSPWR